MVGDDGQMWSDSGQLRLRGAAVVLSPAEAGLLWHLVAGHAALRPLALQARAAAAAGERIRSIVLPSGGAGVRVVTVSDYAAAHHVSVGTVRRWCASGRLAATRCSAGWLIEDPQP
jgi:hypothetical protein